MEARNPVPDVKKCRSYEVGEEVARPLGGAQVCLNPQISVCETNALFCQELLAESQCARLRSTREGASSGKADQNGRFYGIGRLIYLYFE